MVIFGVQCLGVGVVGITFAIAAWQVWPHGAEGALALGIQALCGCVFLCGIGIYLLWDRNEPNCPGQKRKNSGYRRCL
jgi:hypothetical protein